MLFPTDLYDVITMRIGRWAMRIAAWLLAWVLAAVEASPGTQDCRGYICGDPKAFDVLLSTPGMPPAMHDYVKRRVTSHKRYPGLGEAVHRFFDVSSKDLVTNLQRVQRYMNSSAVDVEAPRAAVAILAYQVHCGSDNCVSPYHLKHFGKRCTQRTSVENLVRSLAKNMLSKFPYPLVIFHEDWTEEDKAIVQSYSPTPVFWQQIYMNEHTLPSYYKNRRVIYRFFRKWHPGGNITEPNPKIHGFGYRNMCRFFSSLIFHSPLMQSFDYFMRLDGGDSRIGNVSVDVFSLMHAQKLDYTFRNPWRWKVNLMKELHERWTKANPKVVWNSALKSAFAKQRRMFYNNFEVVRTVPFRTKKHWSYFRLFDEEGYFMCGKGARKGTKSCMDYQTTPGLLLGDADFRSLSLAMHSAPHRIHQLSLDELQYHHPVPDWCEYDEEEEEEELGTGPLAAAKRRWKRRKKQEEEAARCEEDGGDRCHQHHYRTTT